MNTSGDKSANYSGLNGDIQYITALTEKAQPNTEFEVHTHYNEFEIYYFLDGDLFFAFDGKRIMVEKGTMIIIANCMLHKPIIKTPCRYYRKRILFSKKVFTRINTTDFELYNSLRKRKILVFSPKEVETLGLNVLFDEIGASLEAGTAHDEFCALISLFSLLIKAEKNTVKHFENKLCVYSNKAVDIIQYIDEHLAEDLNYGTIAKKFYISEKNLYKFFKKETGFTLSNYINERRIIKALSELNAGNSATEAAAAAGFKDYSVFYRSFLRKVGITPTEYIKNIDKL